MRRILGFLSVVKKFGSTAVYDAGAGALEMECTNTGLRLEVGGGGGAGHEGRTMDSPRAHPSKKPRRCGATSVKLGDGRRVARPPDLLSSGTRLARCRAGKAALWRRLALVYKVGWK